MMWESGPWKVELVRMIDRCERQYTKMGRLPRQTWWDHAARAMQAEKAVFVSAFIIRKLADSARLSVQAEESEVEVRAFPIRDKRHVPDSMNWEDLDRFYDLDAKQRQHVRLRDLVNWIIHSYVFLLEVRSDHAGSEVLNAFYCNSDRLRHHRLVRVAWPDFRGLVDKVARDDVIEVITLRDGHGRDVQLRSATRISAEQRAAFYARHAAFIAETTAQSNQDA